MAKNFWEGDKPAGDDGDFWSSDRPAAQQDLPAGVTPSTAGAGRGSAGPSAYVRPSPAPAPAPSAPLSDPMGSGDFAAAVANPGEERVSVLQDKAMDAPDPARRLSMGAGPISQETAARAERMVDGQEPGAANRPVVERAARGLQKQVDAGQRTTFGDLVERANDPTTQRMARDQTAEEFRSIGEWAVDSSTALASGVVSLAQMVPNIVAPDSALSATLAKAQQGLQDMESAPMQARRQQLADRIKGEDGFLNQYVATVSELVTNPSVAVQESLRQAAMFAGVLGAAKLGSVAAGGAVGAAERVSPTLALGEAISGGALRATAQAGGATAGGVAASSTMAAGDAAGAAYEKLMATDDATWRRSPDFQEMVAKGVPPEQAKQEIAVTKARLAALMAAPLGVLGFMGAEASFAGRAGAGAGRPLRTLGTEMVTEPAEEALTTIAGNTAVQTVNPEQDLLEGAGEAAGMATVTSAPFGGAAAINEMRARAPVDRTEQIKALRSVGDKTAADLLQRRHDREWAAFTTERETEALQPFGPAVQQQYREIRAAGAMPGDAVTQTAARTTFEEAAQAAGLSEKAREAALEKAATMPPDKAPGFLQRALQGFMSRGLAQQVDGVDALATTIETRRDELLDAVLAADIRPTMAAIEQLEKGASGAKTAAADAATVPLDAQNDTVVSREGESVTDNDILISAETDAVHQAATSPLNDRPEPTQAQKEAGNYKLGHVRIGGMDISVENPQGSVRRGTSPDGTTWETPMRDHYGYFRRTTAADGDKLDVFIKPGTPADFGGTVFVVDQVDPGTGKFDEAKVVFGATDQADAEAIYRRNYSANWQGLGAITALPMPAFKAWATSPQTRKPLGVLPSPNNAEVAPPQPTEREAAPDQAAPAAGSDAAAPAASVPATGDAGAVEADGVDAATPPAPSPRPARERKQPAPAAPEMTATLRKDGTLAVKGDPAAIRKRLADAGITNVLAMRGGAMVGKTSAAKAQALLESSENDTAAPAAAAATPTAAPAAKPAAPIEDFGEKLLGARKDYAAQLKDAQDVDVAAEPLSKSWPEPNYQKLLDSGTPRETVDFIRAARDQVPTKPQKSWKLKGWVAEVEALRGIAVDVLAGKTAVADASLLKVGMKGAQWQLTAQVTDEIHRRAELYAAVGHARSLKGVSFAHHHYNLYRGQENVTKWVVEQKAKASAFSNWPRELVVADSKEEMLAQFKAKIDTLTGPAAKAKTSFDLYSKRGQQGVFIGKKIGREHVDLHKAPDIASARKYRDEHQAELEKALERYKQTPFERRTENAARVGDDHRNGAPVTPEIFSETFGFRGVQFGNYVEQGRRQSDLNEAFDALMDMAAVIGVPPRALSLNGRLGLAFGARGRGGKGAPAAHYEPGTVVINLTKGGGPGSLAHEWFHSMDNYFAKEGGGTGFMTDAARGDALRAEMREAFMAIKRALNEGGLRARSLELDKRRSKPYWSTSLEMAARAFESYVIAKLQDQNASNDYLANVVDPKVWEAQEAMRQWFEGQTATEPSYPYPLVDEMPALRAAFDDFFKTVQTRETEGGDVAMFARAYHGTPHRGIERFSTDAIGTGEGAQAYGWGLYFASKQEVAEHYRKGLSYRETVREFRDELDDAADFDEVLDAADSMSPHRARVIRALADEDWLGFDYPAQAITAAFRELDNFDVGQELRDAVKGAQGQLYQVQVPEDSELLKWDVPIGEQGLRKLVFDNGWHHHLRRIDSVKDIGAFDGSALYRALTMALRSDRAASEALADAGVKGIKYLDGTSRKAGEGSHNYVIFSGDDVAIEQTLYSRPLDADLFRRMTTPMQRGMPVDGVEKAIAPVLKRWTSGPAVKVVATPRDLPMEAPADAQGVYYQGQVHLVASNIRNPQQALRVLGHEAIAHYGLREMLGRDGFRQFTNQVQLALATGNKALAAIREEVRAAYVDEDGKFNLTPGQESDEIAAKVVEQAVDAAGNFRPGFGFVKAVYARIAEFLRGLGLTVRFTHVELQGMLVNAQRRLEAGKRTAGARTALEPVWTRSQAPSISAAIIGSNLGAATSHPRYAAAKGGDLDAAVDVARALVSDNLVARVREVIGDRKPTVVPVVSIEASGRNKIPLASGELLAQRLGLATTADIVQANRPKRTALDGLDRIFAVPEFDGPVVAGQDYLILDDTLTQGATFAALAAHIEAGGGRVVGAVALTGKQYSAKIQGSAETLTSLRDKHGDIETDFRAATGYGFDALTESEARYLANFKPADTVRARILAERDAARHGQGQGDAGDLTGPAFARDATLKSPAAVEAEASVDQPPAQGQPDLFTPTFWDVPQDTRTDKFIYEAQDGRIDLKRVQQAIAKVGGEIREQFDARLAETLYPGRVAHRAQQFLEDEARPLLEVMARNNVPMAELSDYLHARGAEERNAQIAKVNPDLPDGGAGRNSKGVLLTNDAARAYLAAVTPARKMVLDALAKRVDAITAGTRKLLVDEGLEKAETIAAWEEAYKNYVPMFRDEAEEGRPHPTGSGMSVRGSASKRATGSTKAVTNILAHVLMQREAAITRAEKNRVAVALYGMALTNPNPDFWATIHPGMSPEAIGRELQRMGVDPTVAQAGMQGVPTIRTVDPVLNRVVDRPNPIYKSMPGAIVLKVNGDDRVLMINAQDPRGLRMAENLKNLDGLTRLDLANRMVGKATRWLASVNTQYNPAFGLVNLTRDTLGGAINLSSTQLRGKTAKVLATTPAAIVGIALELSGRKSGEWGRLFRQFQEDGGQTGYREMFKDANDRTKRLEAELKEMEKSGKLTTQKVAGMLLGALDIFNTTLENAVRLAAYREALDAKMSRPEAARLGRELTVDFNRKGRTGREVGPLYAFFNAAVQGSARTLQALAGPAGAKIIAGGVSLGVIQAVMLLLAGYDDDEVPEFVKSRALVVPLGKDGEGKKQFFTIPYPLGLHVLPNTGRVLAELTLSGGDKAKDKAFDAVGEIAGAFNPLGGGNIFTGDGFLRTVAPSVVDPIIETLANKNFAGTQIERESQGENDPRPGHQRVRESTLRTATGQTYTDISRIINTLTGGTDYEKGAASPSPEMVRYWAQVFGGGLLREIEKTVNTSIDAAKGQPVKAAGVPVLGRFYGEVDDASTERSRYFDNLREIETLERKVKAADKAGDVAAAERMEADGVLIDAGRAARRAKKEITALNKEAMETIGDGAALRAIDEERTAVMRDLNTEVDEIRREKRGPTPGERLREAVRAAVP